ncbi:MAG TPA: dUTP diphosphatase [Acidimicrobiales bacterium]|nr:dUTP diphosphatase [Acidimicrobiales bacterium]
MTPNPPPEIPVVQLDPELPIPTRAHEGDAGFDLLARHDVALEPGGGRALVPTGVAIELPPGTAGLVLPRSGLALHHGVTCLNAPGLIDPSYRGEVGVILVNTDPSERYEVHRGDRIAQLLVVSPEAATLVTAAQLGDSERGSGGFGHTGR